MGRVVRALMKVPAVRRVMVRLANVEAAMARQQTSLDALDHHRALSSSDQAGQQAKLQEMAASLSQAATHDQVAKLSTAIQIQQTQIDALLAHQAQTTSLNEAVRIQQTRIDTLLAQVRQL